MFLLDKDVFGMLFLTMSNINIDFQTWDLQQRSYTTRDVLLTTRQVELMKKKEFIVATFNTEHKAFIVHIAAFSINSSDEMYPSKKAQIAYIKVDEALTKVSSKYADFTNIFLSKLAEELFKHTKINEYTIKLVYD